MTQNQQFLVNLSRLGDLTERVVIVHGMQIDDEYNAGIPILCGAIVPASEMTMDYSITFQPLNDSGVTATGSMSMTGGNLSVMVMAEGVTADEQHLQHIHVVNLGEGETDLCAAYGGILWDLNPFPVADEEGSYSFSESYLVNTDALGDLTTRVVIIHGLMIDDTYNPGTPVACGVIDELVS